MTSVAFAARVLLRNKSCQLRCRCVYATQAQIDPKDHLAPPTRLWRYVVGNFTSFVDKYEKKLEVNTPKVFEVYKTIKCIQYIAKDTHSYVVVAKDIWGGRELHTFSRKELLLYQEMPKDMVKIVALLAIAAIPFVGNFLVIIGYWFPRTAFTHHLWNDKQKEEFSQYFHAKRLVQYHRVLDYMDKQARRHLEGSTRDDILKILDKIENSGIPTPSELLALTPHFHSFPYSVDVLSTSHYRALAIINKFSVRRKERLKQDGLILLHLDRAMVKEGISSLTDQDMCQACMKRGLNPYGLSREERLDYLEKWTSISKNLDETSISLLLHCPALLTYNAPTNIQLMKKKRYRWHRIPA